MSNINALVADVHQQNEGHTGARWRDVGKANAQIVNAQQA